MPLEIIREDITKVSVDAIVNPTDSSLSGGGGVDKAIHFAAGPEMLAKCKALGGCEVGQAKITKAYKLNAKYVIHTVGPVWQGGKKNEEELLADCYRNSLALAKEYNIESIAFPIISSGSFGYPKDRALKTANTVISNFLRHNDMNIFLVVYDDETFGISKKLFSSIKKYINDNYIEEHVNETNELYSLAADKSIKSYERSLDDVVGELDDTFSQTLLRLIGERGMTDPEIYNKANIDRKLFSKIAGNKDYNPSKPTALAFAVALELNLDETKDLLLRAGFALSHSSLSDVIIQFFIEKRNYDIFEINEALFAFDQKLLGSVKA